MVAQCNVGRLARRVAREVHVSRDRPTPAARSGPKARPLGPKKKEVKIAIKAWCEDGVCSSRATWPWSGRGLTRGAKFSDKPDQNGYGHCKY